LKRVTTLITVFLLCHYPLVFSQVKEPVQPYIPEINSQNNFEGYKFKVRIAVQGRDDLIEGEMLSDSGVLTTQDNRSIKIKDISKIIILLWERRDIINRHSFYPSRYEIFFNDNRKVIVNGNIESLNRIKTGTKKSGYVYFYYYDYYKKGKWINSGIPVYNALISKPAEGCAVSIELIQ